MAILLEDLRNVYSFQIDVVNQLEEEFGDDFDDVENEFNEFWESLLKDQIIKYASRGDGKFAGTGCIDYNEAKVIYLFIRTRKPRNILEIGFASGVSSTLIAKALEMNGKGNLYTGDLNSDPSHEWIIPEFKKYIKKGIIKATYPIDGVQFIEQMDKSIPIDLTFSDASHEKDFVYHLTVELREKYPDALHLYHEYSFSPLSSDKFKSFISIKENFEHQRFYEREAFEENFDSDDYEHYGFYGSCGLGVVKKRKQSIAMKVYYRLSNLEAGISKKKIPNATKKYCLENCIQEFGLENITILGDRLNDETRNYVNKLKLRLIEVDNGNGSGTFRDALNLAIKENKDDDLVYLLEDDFLHKPGSKKLLKEGINRFKMYITLYDHPDKYIDAANGGNPQIQQSSEITRIARTNSVHWKLTNSTVMSFATLVHRLKEDYDLLMKYSSNNITDSYGFFTELLNKKQLSAVSSIPGYSTHCEAAWLSPFTDWGENMISLIIPTYRNPDYLDICLKSATEQQDNDNEIIVVIDGFIEESKHILDKYISKIKVLNLGNNQGMQQALNFGVYNASNEKICIINDDNVLCTGWDTLIEEQLVEGEVLTINQIEPTGPSMFNFPEYDFGKNPTEFKYQKFIDYEFQIRNKNKMTPDGGIFPFAMWKKDYMIVGGFDTLYQSPFICDWDFFLKLDLNGLVLNRTHGGHFYHFGSTATKNGKESEKFKASEGPAAEIFMYKWGIPPRIYENLSHNPKDSKVVKGIKYE